VTDLTSKASVPFFPIPRRRRGTHGAAVDLNRLGPCRVVCRLWTRTSDTSMPHAAANRPGRNFASPTAGWATRHGRKLRINHGGIMTTGPSPKPAIFLVLADRVLVAGPPKLWALYFALRRSRHASCVNCRANDKR
jgi:hypothetical protein